MCDISWTRHCVSQRSYAECLPKGGLSGHWSVSVNGIWRLTFAFENGDAILVNYRDVH
jgi:proteic killer suppression protein